MARRAAPSPTVARALTAAVDAMEESYVDWREASRAVADGYRAWVAAPPAERQSRFAAYVAVLEQEEAAATQYAAGIGEVSRLLGQTARYAGSWAPLGFGS